MNRSFLCGFCATSASEVPEFCEKQSQDTKQHPITGVLPSIFNADSNEQYERPNNVRIIGVKQEVDQDVYQKAVDVAMRV